MNKKYELTKETKTIRTLHGGDITLYRIKALRDFSAVKKGNLGGWIESEDNLRHDGKCWVSGNAVVYGNARVSGDAELSRNANIGSGSGYIVIGPIGSRDGYTTIYRTQDVDSVRIHCGCFNGTPDEFFKKVCETHPQSSVYYKQYTTLVNAAINILNEKEDCQRESIDNHGDN